MTHPDESILHDFVDDELAPEARARVAGHLADCANCRSIVSAARSLREEAVRVFSRSDEHAEAPPGLWPAIEARLRSLDEPGMVVGLPDRANREARAHPDRRWNWARPRSSALLRAAAVILLIGLTSAVTYVATRSGSGGAVVADGAATGGEDLTLVLTAADAGVPGVAAAGAIAGAYGPVLTELERIVEEGRGRLRPETIATLEENLRILDTAIRDIEAALAADPARPSVLRSLDGMYEAKLELLQQAVTLTRGA